VSPFAAAVFRNEPVVVTDIATDPQWVEFGRLARPHGLRAAWSQPILSRDSGTLGAVIFCFSQPQEPNADDCQVMESIAALAQFAIDYEKRERSRRFANERFEALANTILGVVYQRVVTPDGDIRYTYISEGAKDLFGVSAEEILADPKALFDCHGPEYRATFRERLLEASRNLEIWDVEAQIITRDGEEKWTHAKARPHRQPDGSVLWDGVILDATWIKKTELELRRAKEAAEASSRAYAKLLAKFRSANERFVSLAATIPGVVYQRQVTPDGEIRYTYISEGSEDLFGVSPDEILADPQALFDCHGPEYRATFRERLLKASRDLEMWDVEAQIITRDGQEKWTHAIARPHRQPDGSVLWDGVILDATWIKKTELELRKAKEAANASSRAKTAFLAQIGHELRTPLNAIIGFSEILVCQSHGALGNSKYLEYSEHINNSGLHLLELIEDILQFTKSETGRLELVESKFSIEHVVDLVVRQIAPSAETAQVRLNKRIDNNLPDFFGDAGKIKKLIAKLLSNAIKFTPQGGDVRISATVDSLGDIVIRVTDTGIGITPGDIPKVFEPFGQVDSELSRKYEGTGLGIPLAVAMTKLHGGRLAFESEIGSGTTATLVLPKARIVGAADNAASA